MKTFEITEQQIKKLSEQSIIVEQYLKEWFPAVFEIIPEKGRWYKNSDGTKWLLYVVDLNNSHNLRGYGFNANGKWQDDDGFYQWAASKYIEATPEEVEEALIAEAKRRGFKEGVTFNSLYTNNVKWNNSMRFDYDGNQNNLWVSGRYTIFSNGKWAEIINEPVELTLEEIAEKFNINVEQLKIKF